MNISGEESASLPLGPLHKRTVEALSRFIHPPVAPEPSLPMKLVTGRGDSSNAIFVTPSWDSLSPLLLLRAQPAQPPQMN